MEAYEDSEKKPLLASHTCKTTSDKEQRKHKTPGTQACVMWIALICYSCGLTAGMGTMKQYTYKAVRNFYNLSGSDSDTVQNKGNSEGGCGANSTSSNSNHEEAADWLLYFELIEYSLVFPVVALCGIYSDFYGRKPFILLSSIGCVLEYSFFACVIYFHLPLPYLLIGYAIGGLTGSEHVLFMCCCAATADTTEDNKSRSFYMACLYLCLGLGVSMSQVGIGFAINYFGFVIPNVISVFISIMSVTLFCNMPETYQNRNEHKPFCQSLSRLIGFYHDKSYLKNTPKWKFVLCLFAFILCLSPFMCRSNVETLYQLGEPFCFTSEQIGYYGALKELVQLTFGTLILKLLHFCLNDEIILYFGCLSAITYFLMEGFAINSWMIYSGIYSPYFYLLIFCVFHFTSILVIIIFFKSVGFLRYVDNQCINLKYILKTCNGFFLW
ncbi:hypothetical protein FSP39_017445 [Pinctada imbricata]|uniref:Proton-coupled folate transporter n=1 Tax=Pinctada imbricata TaxID=66713 RepID=A0AA88YPS0_PINIB|nr:hypothetical protein FSP39_017445 [Pinctada imbricata]